MYIKKASIKAVILFSPLQKKKEGMVDDDDHGSLAHLCRTDHIARRGLMWLFLEHATQHGFINNKTAAIQSALLDAFIRGITTIPMLPLAYAALVRAGCDNDTLTYIRQCNAPYHTLHWLITELGGMAPQILKQPSIANGVLVQRKVIVIWPCGFV